MHKIILRHKFALGDSVLLTGLCRDIHLAHPGKYELVADANYSDVFLHNPNVRPVQHNEQGQTVNVKYGAGIPAAGRGMRAHMLTWFHKNFSQTTGIKTPVLFPKGDLHLTEQEKIPPVSGRYWVVIAGGKSDAPVKVWRSDYWQQTIDMLKGHGIHCVQTGADHQGHFHHKLTGVIDLVGQLKSSRDLLSLIHGADGVICGITGAMHIAACFDKPCVVIAGGREEPWWESYTLEEPYVFGTDCAKVVTPHRFLHTIGELACCKTKGCWKHRLKRTDDRSSYDRKLCALPLFSPVVRPACMDLITPEHVVSAVLNYQTVPGVPSMPVVTRMLDKPLPLEVIMRDTPKPPPPPLVRENCFIHPLIGKFTVCVLCYGDYPQLAKNCLGSIFETLDRSYIDLRVGLNAVCRETEQYVERLEPTAIYRHPENAHKYPVMREMFHDPQHPINTSYVVWFDDDTKVVSAAMWRMLAESIIANHPRGARLYGWPMVHDTAHFSRNGHDATRWFKDAAWWRGRHLHTRGRPTPAPNGTVVPFVPGWFWAIATETIRRGDIPDTRLGHNGGDITIGCQAMQAGAIIKSFNANKSLVWCPSKEGGGRRGYSEAFPWGQTAVMIK